MALAAVISLYAAFLVVGWFAARKVKDGTATDLIVAGRAMPLWIATLTMTATWVDGGYLLGTAEGVYKSSVALGVQGGLCFGISLILGGLFFAKTMRRHEFTTLIDPFEARFGKHWAAVLFVPALLGVVFWSAELLVAVGSTISVMAGVKLSTAILLSAMVIVLYTMLGGMWSVAYTDAFQLGLVALGLLVALPFMLEAVGGLSNALLSYQTARPDRVGLLPPLPLTPQASGGFWTTPTIFNWWDVSAMLVFGGIPWNCYFQRVLSCQTPKRAQQHSIFAGLLTIAFTVPPLLLGLSALSYRWPANFLAQLQEQPSQTLPMIFQYVMPPLIGLLGLGAQSRGLLSPLRQLQARDGPRHSRATVPRAQPESCDSLRRIACAGNGAEGRRSGARTSVHARGRRAIGSLVEEAADPRRRRGGQRAGHGRWSVVVRAGAGALKSCWRIPAALIPRSS